MSKNAKYEGPPPCGLFIPLQDQILGMELIKRVREIFFTINHYQSNYKKNFHVLFATQSLIKALDEDQLRILSDMAKQQGIVFLLENHIDLAAKIEADGVLLDQYDDLARALDVMDDDDHIIGLRCGIDIDLAEKSIQDGADFVSFHTKNKSLVDPKTASVWSTLSEMPCVMEGPFTNDYAAAYVVAGSSFIEAGEYILNHKDGVKQGTVNMLHAIELAAEESLAKKH